MHHRWLDISSLPMDSEVYVLYNSRKGKEEILPSDRDWTDYASRGYCSWRELDPEEEQLTITKTWRDLTNAE